MPNTGSISDARSRVSTESASMEATIEKLEQVRQLMERDRAEAARQLRAAEEDRRKAERMQAELSVRLEKADEKARRDAERKRHCKISRRDRNAIA